ncbi:hypothetical protein BZL30_5506 [Mycobacterium kansasii]|uniref:Uncharacterized protein n=1 Tax=Mycobacterium kansasii TaxID=1768 RepID=A0A1V3WZ44_MYCKA|nr:hypothetical protein BZL30_5506 [Mycobacterium kansasii]
MVLVRGWSVDPDESRVGYPFGVAVGVLRVLQPLSANGWWPPQAKVSWFTSALGDWA